jgi:hypothetical protein
VKNEIRRFQPKINGDCLLCWDALLALRVGTHCRASLLWLMKCNPVEQKKRKNVIRNRLKYKEQKPKNQCSCDEDWLFGFVGRTAIMSCGTGFS